MERSEAGMVATVPKAGGPAIGYGSIRSDGSEVRGPGRPDRAGSQPAAAISASTAEAQPRLRVSPAPPWP